jgi:hypothetical protein
MKHQKVHQLVEAGLGEVTAERWQVAIHHSIQEEQRLWKLDGCTDNIAEKLVINVRGYETSSDHLHCHWFLHHYIHINIQNEKVKNSLIFCNLFASERNQEAMFVYVPYHLTVLLSTWCSMKKQSYILQHLKGEVTVNVNKKLLLVINRCYTLLG